MTAIHSIETNPMPVKYASSLLKKSDGSMRLPLVTPTTATQKTVRDAMADLHKKLHEHLGVGLVSADWEHP